MTEEKNLSKFQEFVARKEASQTKPVPPNVPITTTSTSASLDVIPFARKPVVPHRYFPSPTSADVIAPAFSLGLQKQVTPIEMREGYHLEAVYLSIEKPQSKVEIQASLLDEIPEERLEEIHRTFKENLTPYGLKILYLVIEECGANNRQPWFTLDTNRCLDIMGYQKKPDGGHRQKNKERFLQQLEELTRITFNVEKREPKRGVKGKDVAIRFQAPLLSRTGKFEVWEVEAGKPLEEGVKIRDETQVFIHPEVYKYVNQGWYTVIPMAFLTIDAGSHPHAILLYSYIATQWRIGLKQHRGTIKQPMRQLLDGAGLLRQLPKRRNQQRAFVERIKGELDWLRNQKAFWIKSVRYEEPIRFLDQRVIIEMAKEHPLPNKMRVGELPDGTT